MKKIIFINLLFISFLNLIEAAPSYSDVGQNLTYVKMNESIELRAKWIPIDIPYDVSIGIYNDNFYISEDDHPTGVVFNNNGTKLYVIGEENAAIYEYNLSTPYDISTAVYNDNLSVSSQDIYPQDLIFNNNGTKLYIVGIEHYKVYEYNLSTPYDISTGVYNDDLYVGNQDEDPKGIAFNNNGTKLYVMGEYNSKVFEYNLSTPYDISTGIYNDFLDVSDIEGNAESIAFNNDGTKLYIVGYASVGVNEYNLSTPYDVSTGIYNDDLKVISQDYRPSGMTFNNNGTKLYVIGYYNDAIYEYNLTGKLDTAVLNLNITGSWTNISTIDLGDSLTPKWSNFSYTTPNQCNKIIQWKITANDSSGTSNTTTIETFYVMPYLYSTSNNNIINSIENCSSNHNATITPIGTGEVNVTFLVPYFIRNSTFKECSYEVTEDYDEIIITNTSEYCNITVINLKAENGVKFNLQDSTKLILNSPPNQKALNNMTPSFNFTMIGKSLNSYPCELFINDTGYGTVTADNNTPTIVIANQSLSDGVYNWYINCSVGDDVYQSEIRELIIDTINPLISNQQISINYYNGTVNLSNLILNVDKKNIKINVSASDIHLDSVWARVYNSMLNYLMTLISGTIYEVNISLSKGSYNISSFVNDTAGNLNNTENQSIMVSDFNLSSYIEISDYKWDTYRDIIANSNINKVKWINNTGVSLPYKLKISGYYVNGDSCEVNDILYSVSNGICNYTHIINKNSVYPNLEFYDSDYGTGTPVIQTFGDEQTALKKWFRNITLNYYLPNNSIAPPGTFINSTTTALCIDSTVTSGEYIKYYNGTEFINITPSTQGVWEKKIVDSRIFYVIKDDFCYGDGIMDFKVKIESNS